MSRVRPGVLLVRASPWRPRIALMALDLPAFERPAKATSAPRSAGNCPAAAALTRNFALGNAATAVVYNPALSHHWQYSGKERNDGEKSTAGNRLRRTVVGRMGGRTDRPCRLRGSKPRSDAGCQQHEFECCCRRPGYCHWK